jgi:hypothetical protein
MRISYIFLNLLLIACAGVRPICAQVTYHDASAFPLCGKISDSTETCYERLPATLKGVTRQPVWDLGKNTAGLAVRFCSNSAQIAVRWELLADNKMDHMAWTGIKGLDLYCLEGDVWTFVNTARPYGKTNERVVISGMETKAREWMMFLPLYDGITALEIGVDSLAWISPPKRMLPAKDKPVVAYGTSILQGGCASRPGMAHTNILMRRLNREVINLGFSGNGKLDYEIAEVMAQCDASLYILDFMPNVNLQQIVEKTEKFFSIIRNKKPDVPVLFIENPVFPPAQYKIADMQDIEQRNKALNAIVAKLKKDGDQNVWILSSQPMIGDDGEATVDGVHFTDLGFMRYAEYLFPVIKKIL